MLLRRISVLWFICQLWTCNWGKSFTCLINTMLELLPGLLKLHHLLLHLLLNLLLVIQLFSELLNATAWWCSISTEATAYCKQCNQSKDWQNSLRY